MPNSTLRSTGDSETLAMESTATPSTASGVSVEFQNVNHSFLHGDRPVRVLDNFNLRIEPSEFVSIVGPSGCGKTTALGMVGNLLKPRAGKVLIDGKPVRPGSNDAAFLFARDALLPWRRVRSNVELGMEIRGVPKEERRVRAEEWLRKVRLHEFADSDVLHLSQGMRQRVAIARTLVQNPKVLLMDEPFAALDAQTRAIQQEEFTGLWEAERPTVIFVTHDLEEAILLERPCDSDGQPPGPHGRRHEDRARAPAAPGDAPGFRSLQVLFPRHVRSTSERSRSRRTAHPGGEQEWLRPCKKLPAPKAPPWPTASTATARA